MTMTLGEALMTDNDRDIDLKDPTIDTGITKAQKELPKARKKINRAAVNGALKKAVLMSMDIALDELLGRAWSTWKDMRVYADPAQTPPEDINVVPLADHTIESAHEPTVDVMVAGAPAHTFRFGVAVTLDVQGANLVIQHGMIQEIQLAHLKLGGSVTLLDRTLLEKDIGEIKVPAVMKLRNPMPIRSDLH